MTFINFRLQCSSEVILSNESLVAAWRTAYPKEMDNLWDPVNSCNGEIMWKNKLTGLRYFQVPEDKSTVVCVELSQYSHILQLRNFERICLLSILITMSTLTQALMPVTSIRELPCLSVRQYAKCHKFFIIFQSLCKQITWCVIAGFLFDVNEIFAVLGYCWALIGS